MKTDKQIAASAAEFAERWKGKGYERGQSQLFWADLLTSQFLYYAEFQALEQNL